MTEERKELINKIMGLFTKYGIRSITTNDIARELGISKKTLYEYFKDKSEIVECSLNLIYENRLKQFEEIKQKKLNAIESLLEIYQLVTEMIKTTSPTLEHDLRKYYPETFTKVYGKGKEMLYKMHVENIRQGQAEGLFRDVDPDIIARLVCHRAQTFMLEVFSTEEIYSGKIHRELFLYHLFGMCSAKGYAIVASQMDKFNASTTTQN